MLLELPEVPQLDKLLDFLLAPSHIKRARTFNWDLKQLWPIAQGSYCRESRKHPPGIFQTTTVRKTMTWSTVPEIIFQRLATVIKSGEIIKKPFWRQQYLSFLLPSLYPAPPSITTLLPSPILNQSFSRESHLWCSLFLGKHWPASRCLTPSQAHESVYVAQMWPVT